MSSVQAVTDDSFEDMVLKSDLPVLVDFWATWCGPCRQMAPVMDQVADKYVGKIHVVKMDVDENSDTPSRYGIRSIPTFLLFKNGGVVAQEVGAQLKSSIYRFIDSNI